MNENSHPYDPYRDQPANPGPAAASEAGGGAASGGLASGEGSVGLLEAGGGGGSLDHLIPNIWGFF